MRPIAVAAVAVLLAAAAVKDGRVLERTHLVGACSTMATPRGASGTWEACRPGRLAGRPDLSVRSCTRRDLVAEVELWRCPGASAPPRAA